MADKIHLCHCGEIFRSYFCKKCEKFQQEQCKQCHKQHYDEIRRMKELAGLKRGFHV